MYLLFELRKFYLNVLGIRIVNIFLIINYKTIHIVLDSYDPEGDVWALGPKYDKFS